MKILRIMKKFMVGIVFAVMLALNVATVAVESVSAAASFAYEFITGGVAVTTVLASSVRSNKSRVAQLETDLNAKNRQVASLSDELADSRAARTVVFRGERMLLSEAVEHTSERVGKRLVVSTGRSVGAVFGEAVPFFGIAVIVAATTWELSDACDTMDDLYELDIAFNPDNVVPADHSEVCGLQVPTKEEIWQFVKDSPGAAWEMAKELMPELPEFEMPEVELLWPWEWF